MLKIIESINNKKIQDLYKLKNKSEILSNKKFLLEGKNLIFEAYKTNIILELLLTKENEKKFENYDVKKTLVNEKIIKKLSQNKTNKGIIAVCKYEQKKNDLKKFNRIIVLDSINNPKNLGAIIRSASAFNYDAVVLLNDSTFPYNNKSIKSSQGAVFNFPVFSSTVEELKMFYPYFFVLQKNSKNLLNLSKPKIPFALVFGNEANGISNELLNSWKGENVFIKINSKLVQSLNISNAASIAMFNFFD